MAEIGKRFARKELREVAWVAKADTILAGYRRLQTLAVSGLSSRFSRSGSFGGTDGAHCTVNSDAAKGRGKVCCRSLLIFLAWPPDRLLR
jgi:hypothetical protein